MPRARAALYRLSGSGRPERSRGARRWPDPEWIEWTCRSARQRGPAESPRSWDKSDPIGPKDDKEGPSPDLRSRLENVLERRLLQDGGDLSLHLAEHAPHVAAMSAAARPQVIEALVELDRPLQ